MTEVVKQRWSLALKVVALTSCLEPGNFGYVEVQVQNRRIEKSSNGSNSAKISKAILR